MLFSLFGMMIAFSSCEEEPEVMELPPAKSLVIDWDMFPTQSANKSLEDGALPMSYRNWLYSAGSVFVWNTVVAANMAIPTIAYTAAFDHEPVYLGDNSWEWSYSVPFNTRTIHASLVGTRLDNETFSMKMTLSEEGGFPEFKWFEGVIRYDHTYANWTLNHSPDNPVEYLDVVFNRDFETERYQTRYTVIDPSNDLYNGYVDFSLDPEQDYDAQYTVSRNDTTTSIEWSTETKAGRVKDSRQFGDSEWHCWDTLLQDVDCGDEDLPPLSGKD